MPGNRSSFNMLMLCQDTTEHVLSWLTGEINWPWINQKMLSAASYTACVSLICKALNKRYVERCRQLYLIQSPMLARIGSYLTGCPDGCYMLKSKANALAAWPLYRTCTVSRTTLDDHFTTLSTCCMEDLEFALTGVYPDSDSSMTD